MHTYLRAIGFRECKNRQQLEDIYRHTLNTPNRKIMTTISVDTSLLQFEKDFGKNFGLSLVGEYDIKGSLSIEHYFPYLKGDRFMQFENITIQKQTDKESYAGVCEDYHLGMTIIFYVINIADYAKSKWLNYSQPADHEGQVFCFVCSWNGSAWYASFQASDSRRIERTEPQKPAARCSAKR